MRLHQYVEDDVSGNLSHTKLWSNIAFFTMTIAFAKIAWQSAPSDSLAILFLVYGGVVGGSQVASKFLSLKFGGQGNGGGGPKNETPASK